MDDLTVLKDAVPLLLKWYGVSKRELPWRGERDFYRVWVSEIMLQQTRVEAVKEYYLRFLQRFPTAEKLAEADEDEVLKAWQGLGYYSRARNLHAAAKKVVCEGIPRTWCGVRALPGIGDYTAGSICSIALGLPEPAVDGNVVRVLSRLLARGSTDAAFRTEARELLRLVYPPRTADFCEALMELGAIVCLPNGVPLCGECPWKGLCRAHAQGRETEYPLRREKKARRVEKLRVFVLRREGKYALRKRTEGLLKGMWEFPNTSEEVLPPGKILAAKEAKHIFTHVEWHMTGFLAETEDCFPCYVWATAEQIRAQYAIPSAFRAFLEWIV